jgi:hypothetical protein
MNGWSPRLSLCYGVTRDNENIRRYCTNKVVDINTVWKNAGAAAERGFAIFSPISMKRFFGERDKKYYRPGAPNYGVRHPAVGGFQQASKGSNEYNVYE